MLLIGKQKPEIELTVGLLRLGQGHKSVTEVNRQWAWMDVQVVRLEGGRADGFKLTSGLFG